MEKIRLIERCRQGDADALGELYKAYAQQMRGVCRRYFSDEQTVDDVLHDAFVIIFTSFDRLRDTTRAEAWMTAITRNVASKCKDHLEALSTVSLDETSEARLVAAENGEKDVRGIPLSEVVKMIDRLPGGYGQVFRLSVFEGMSHKEIADMLGIEPHSSSSQLARAKKMLRKMMHQYWVAMLLLLLVPVTFLLLRKSVTVVKDEDDGEYQSSDGAYQSSDGAYQSTEQEPITVDLPMRRTTVAAIDTLQSVIALTMDSVSVDTLPSLVAQLPTITDTTTSDTTKTIHQEKLTHHEVAELLHEKPTTGTNNDRKWSLQLAYAGMLDQQNSYNQPFSYKPYIDPNIQHSPGPGPVYITPSSIDNWTDYAVYLANNPGVVSDKTRSVIMRIALNNASQPGEDKMLRTSHHQMPVTWSLALNYRLNSRFSLEAGVSYSRLSSNFEMGASGNSISEQQAIHYLGIPMKGIYNMYGSRRWGIYGSFGLTTEMPVYTTLQSDFYVNGVHEATDKTSLRAPWQLSTTLGLGLQFHLTPNVGLFVEPSLQYYIPMGSHIETYRTEHPLTFSLPLGIRFTW